MSKSKSYKKSIKLPYALRKNIFSKSFFLRGYYFLKIYAHAVKNIFVDVMLMPSMFFDGNADAVKLFTVVYAQVTE